MFPRHYPNHATLGLVGPHYNNNHLGPDPMKKALQREYHEEEFDDEDDVSGKKMRGDGYDGYSYTGGKSLMSAPMVSVEGQSKNLQTEYVSKILILDVYADILEMPHLFTRPMIIDKLKASPVESTKKIYLIPLPRTVNSYDLQANVALSSLTRTKLSFKPSHQSFRPKNFRSGVVVAKYGDKSMYFDLKDLGNTTSQWDLYGSDAPSPYNTLQALRHWSWSFHRPNLDYSERFPSDQERASQRTGIHSFFLSSFLLHFFLMTFFTFIGMHIHAQVNLVTETDLACEDLIFTHLKQVYPTHKFIGKETTTVGGNAELTDETTLIVDPLDGTTNFVHGIPTSKHMPDIFGTIVFMSLCKLRRACINSWFRIASNQRLNDIVGNAYYVAPEVLHRSYSVEGDLWSIGVISYILLCGTRPFWARTESGIFLSFLSANPNIDDSPWPSISPEAKDFLKRLLNKDHRKRTIVAQALGDSVLKFQWNTPRLNPEESNTH
ncbi:hypothetical protein JHK87_024839 [Glycine soja]|nr:hypothetical protein JHK87_024839 [Glycine soja]